MCSAEHRADSVWTQCHFRRKKNYNINMQLRLWDSDENETCHGLCPMVVLNLQGLLPHCKDVHELRNTFSLMQQHILAQSFHFLAWNAYTKGKWCRHVHPANRLLRLPNFKTFLTAAVIRGAPKWWGLPGYKAPKSKFEISQKRILRDLPFSRNQPLIPAHYK